MRVTETMTQGRAMIDVSITDTLCVPLQIRLHRFGEAKPVRIQKFAAKPQIKTKECL